MTNPTPAPHPAPISLATLPDRLVRWADRTLNPNRPVTRPVTASGWRGLYLGAGRNGPVSGGPEHHGLIIGPPRSGKTTRLVIPNINCHPGPVVATSTKTDIAAATWATRSRLGTCWLWDPTGTLTPPPGVQPLRWSPISGCHTWDAAVARAHALATAARPGPAGPATTSGETHWVERAQALLAPLLHAANLHHTDMGTLLGWLHRRDLVEALDVLTTHDADMAADLLVGISVTDPREQSGIFSTADGLLAPYRTTTALTATRNPNFDPAHFAASTDTIYLCAPGTAQTQTAPLIICLLDQIRSAAYTTKPWPSMLWALDELANIAPLPDLPNTISEGASQGLIVLACLQDLSQARARWGTAADGFATLFTHKLVLPGIADLATLRQISALAGDTDITHTSRTRDPYRRTTTTTTTQRRPRLPPDTIANSTPGHAIWLNHTTLRTVRLPPWLST
jgi:type IV secretion system protein VirD4